MNSSMKFEHEFEHESSFRGGDDTRLLVFPPCIGLGGEGSSRRRGRSFSYKSYKCHEASAVMRMRGCLVARLVALTALWHCADALVTPSFAAARASVAPSLFGPDTDVRGPRR